MLEGRDLSLQSNSDSRASLKWCLPYELRTKFRLGRPVGEYIGFMGGGVLRDILQI